VRASSSGEPDRAPTAGGNSAPVPPSIDGWDSTTAPVGKGRK
jgi:hypothetical protein